MTMDPTDYNRWSPQQPSDDFAERAVDAMLGNLPLALEGEEPGLEAAPMVAEAVVTSLPHGRRARRAGGFLLTFLAAALVATAASGMWLVERMSYEVPVLEPSLPEVEVPALPARAPAPTVALGVPEVEVEEEVVAAVPRPYRPAPPAVQPPKPVEKPQKVHTPTCACLPDAVVCGCVE